MKLAIPVCLPLAARLLHPIVLRLPETQRPSAPEHTSKCGDDDADSTGHASSFSRGVFSQSAKPNFQVSQPSAQIAVRIRPVSYSESSRNGQTKYAVAATTDTHR